VTRDDHIKQAGRIIASLKKLSMPDDYLAIVDGAMIVGYHLGNALLHAHGVLADTEHANTPSKLDRPLTALPAPMRPAYEAFAELEKLRFDYVRSASTYDDHLSSVIWHHLEAMQRACRDQQKG
jgi:hypothetical protein